MIIGNPYCFAVVFEVVECWNVDRTFQNGILFLAVNGEIFPEEIQSATLSFEVSKLTDSLKNIPVDEKIFSMPVKKAYSEIYNKVFPVSNGEKIRILAGKPDYCKEESVHISEGAEITETFVDISEMNDIITKLSDIDIKEVL